MDTGRALVTGAAKRLGRAMALDLAATGWDVALHYNGSEALARSAEAEAAALPGRVVALKADLLDIAAVEALVARASETLGGPITLLVNNASIFEDDRLRAEPPARAFGRESWDRAIGSNLRAPMALTAAFAAQAPRATSDAAGEPVAQAMVLNMIDQRVWKPTPVFQSYTAAKAGLWMLTRTAAQELAPDIRVNAIGPGPTLRAERQTESHFARQRAACLLGRGSDVEDILAALRFFMVCKAVTGQMIAVDGGQHLAWQTPDVLGVEP